MVNMSEVLLQISAYENTHIVVNGKKVYIALFYSGLHMASFKIKTDYFGEVIYEGKTFDDLKNYLNTL